MFQLFVVLLITNIMISKKFGFSTRLTPVSFLIDLILLNSMLYLWSINFINPAIFHGYLSLSWLVIAIQIKFYNINRYSKVTHINKLLFKQFVFFLLFLFAFIGFFRQPIISRLELGKYFVSLLIAVSYVKLLTYLILLRYRKRFASNLRKVAIIGSNKKTNQLLNVFLNRTEFGYLLYKQYKPINGAWELVRIKDEILDEEVQEIYCSISELNDHELTSLIDFSDNNLITLKFIQDNRHIYTKKLKFEYYDYIPVLSLRNIPLHNPINSFFKRTFDIVFSLLVIVLLLSWLTPLLALLIKLESKGPVFFRQKRNGIDNREFYCYKFRSMTPNQDADTNSATKNDMRVTRVGKFIRRTSIDELPQFYNVFFGSMSVVGPRPHMVKHTTEFADRIDKFMVRHFVKPGITGLAQVRGYRGEIETDADIQNRIKFDIFYIENWSMFLDLKIIVQTVLNIFRKEEKAY